MARETEQADPRGLIRESYRIEGIGMSECRSIFLDWAISVPDGVDSAALAGALLAQYGAQHPDHPMTQVLREAMGPTTGAQRRGGARARRREA